MTLKTLPRCSTFAVLLSGCLLFAGMTLAQNRVHDPLKPEVLTLPLLPEGFASAQVNIDAGIYIIQVLNRTSVRGINVAIDRMPGASLQAVPQQHEFDGPEDTKRLNFAHSVTLTHGTYRIQITGHNTWLCALNVK